MPAVIRAGRQVHGLFIQVSGTPCEFGVDDSPARVYLSRHLNNHQAGMTMQTPPHPDACKTPLDGGPGPRRCRRDRGAAAGLRPPAALHPAARAGGGPGDGARAGRRRRRAVQPGRDDGHPLHSAHRGGLVGHAYVAGRDERQAELAALVDALMQDPDRAAPLEAAVIAPLEAAQQAGAGRPCRQGRSHPGAVLRHADDAHMSRAVTPASPIRSPTRRHCFRAVLDAMARPGRAASVDASWPRPRRWDPPRPRCC